MVQIASIRLPLFAEVDLEAGPISVAIDGTTTLPIWPRRCRIVTESGAVIGTVDF